jgi:cell division protein FtsA
MKRLVTDNIVTAIDVGTTKVCVLICRVNEAHQLELLGAGTHPSYGMKKGIVTNISMTVHAIKRALEQATHEANMPITSAILGISGGHIQSFNSIGIVPIHSQDVSQIDIDRVIESARAVPIPDDREILHVIPQYFKVDGQEPVQTSYGMHGVRLEAQVHIVTGSVASAQNLIKAAELAEINVTDIVLEQIASSQAVLSPSEQELGVGLLDIGGGTSDFAIYKNGKIMHSHVIPMAGNHFTNDLAIGLEIPLHLAEKVKCEYGHVTMLSKHQANTPVIHLFDEDENIDMRITPQQISDILRPRAIEVLDFMVDEILSNNLRTMLPAGIVLTGGGALLEGLRDLATEISGLPVRIGQPHIFAGSSLRGKLPPLLQTPIYSTAYGIVLHALQGGDLGLEVGQGDHLATKIIKRMKGWLYDFI